MNARDRRILLVTICVIAILSWLVPVLRSMPQTYPENDHGNLLLYTHLASRGDLSVGAYSRFGWNHPGPAYFYVMAPLYMLTDHHAFSMRWTVLALNLASVFAAIILLGKYGGRSFGLGLMAVFVLYFFRSDRLGLLVDLWNPHVIMLPFTVLLVLCARLASGGVSVLPWIVLVASFVTQTHIGILPTTAAVTVVAAFSFVLSRASGKATVAGYVYAAIGVFVLLWFLPLAEQLRAGFDGNLARIVNFFIMADSGSTAPTLSQSFNALCYALYAPIRGTASTIIGFHQPAAVWSMLQLSLLAGFGILAVRNRQAFRAALCFVGLVAVGAAFWSITQVRGPLYGYLIHWIYMISVVNTAALLGFIIDGIAGAVSRLGLKRAVLWPAAVLAFGVALTVQGVLMLHDVQRLELNAARISPVRTLSGAIEADLRYYGKNRPLIWIHDNESWPRGTAIMLQLYKADIPLAVSDYWLFMFTSVFRSAGLHDVEYFIRASPVDVAPPYRLVYSQDGTFVYAHDGPR